MNFPTFSHLQLLNVHVFFWFQIHRDLVEADGWVTDKGYSQVDVEAVDMLKFPKLQQIPWYSAKLKKGDCLFIPSG